MENIIPTIYINELAVTTQERTLGIIVESYLKKNQLSVQQQSENANRMLGIIKKGMENKTLSYCFYVNLLYPQLLFSDASTIFWNWKKFRKATQITMSIEQLSDEERLVMLRFSAGKKDDQGGNMMEVYKIMTGVDKVEEGAIFLHFQDLRGDQMK